MNQALPLTMICKSRKYSLREIMLLLAEKDIPLSDLMDNIEEWSKALAFRLSIEVITFESHGKRVVAFLDPCHVV